MGEGRQPRAAGVARRFKRTKRYDVQVAVDSSVASFDADFDQVAWLHRLARPEDVAP